LYDIPAIREMVANAGFIEIKNATIAHASVAPSGESVAKGALLGTPVFGQLSELGVEAANYVPLLAEEVDRRFGPGEIRAPMSAIVFEARKPVS